MSSRKTYSARCRERAAQIVQTRSPLEVLQLFAEAEDEFDFVFADALNDALSAEVKQARYSLTPAGEALLRDTHRKRAFDDAQVALGRDSMLRMEVSR